MAYSKKIILCLLIIFILLSFFSSVYAVTDVNPTEINGELDGITQHDNVYDTLRNMQIDHQNSFITKFYALYSQNNLQWKANAELIYQNLIYAGGGGQRGILVTIDDHGNYQVSTYSYVDVKKNPNIGAFQYNNMNFAAVAFADVVVSRRYLTKDNIFYGTDGEVLTQLVPEAFTHVMSDRWIDMFIDFGIITTATDQAILDILRQSSGVDVSQKLQNIDNSVNNLNGNITSDYVDVDSSSLPSDNTSDITGDGFDSIFNQIYTTFTSNVSKDLVITIPFTKKSFTINSQNVYGNANLGFVKTLIQAFWYFVISYFIVQDIAKKINKIKSGDIEHIQEDNIKEDLL